MAFKYGSFVQQMAVTATAAGTTTLTDTSKQLQVFTGTTTQTIVLPDATTMSVGQSFEIFNQSTGTLTLEFNGGAAFTDATGKNYSLITTLTSINVVLQTNGTSAGTWAVVASSSAGLSAPGPTVQKFLSGSGTYTTPANVSFIEIEMVGGGGGGTGSGTAAGTLPTAGGNSSFGTSLLTANGGGVSTFGGGSGGTGGSASLGSGPLGIAFSGANGGGGSALDNLSSSYAPGGMGGSTPFGGAGSNGGNSVAGTSAAANTGSGGGGAGTEPAGGVNAISGGGGGAGGYINAIIVSPAASYAYSIGAAGTAGGAGSSGFAGGSGAAGIIVIKEYYQ